ncbi:MAG: tetratricopeptide repeat protein [Candidatus Obscuribacterales bacterium]|nr:tetratricopeptide repeat protein [Candidatus Obscuribacterales bacterium]
MHLKKYKIRTLTWVIAWSMMLPQVAIPAAYAQSANVSERLINYEKVLFGEQTSGDSVDKRIQNLEKQIFGKVQKGSNEQRLDAIGKLIDGQKNSAYFPPIPPQLDRSAFAPEPKAAPKNSGLSTDTLTPLTANTDDRVHAMLKQAMALYSQGKVNEAQKVYQQVLGLDFHNTDANFNLGSIAEDRQDYASASKYYAAASAADPSDLEIKDALKNVQEKLRKPQATASRPAPTPAAAPAALPPVSEDSTALKQIAADAAVSYKKGNFDDAISKLTYLAKKNPYDANTQFALGQAWRGKGNNGEALKHLRAAATLNPKNDLYVSTLNQTQASSSSQQIAASNEPGPVGEITPFQGIPSNDLASGNLGGLGQIQGLLGRALPGMMIGGQIDSYGMGMGGLGGLGGIGGLGGGLPYFGSATANGYPMMQTGGTRITRVMRAALSGAAVGALSNRGYPGGMTAGAKQGALYGGLMQMMTGGF